MKISKIIAIVGAVLLFVCFFLPWESLSFMGTEIYYSGYQKAAGSPPGNYKLSVNPSDYGAESDLDYINQVWGGLLGDTLSSEEIGAISGITDVINRAFAKPILYLFPIAAILVVAFSILSNRKPHISFGIVMVALALVMGIILLSNGKSMATLMKLGDLAGSVLSLFGMQEIVPTSQFEIGYFGSLVGILAFLVAGFIGWQDYSKPATVPNSASFQNAPGYGYQNQNYPQQYPSNQQQAPQPQNQSANNYYTNKDSSAFFYQQNHLQQQNYQQSAPTSQQQPSYNTPPTFSSPPQQGYQAPVSYQQPPNYQSQPQYQPQPLPQPQPQQPTPPQQNTPDKPVAGWRPILPPEDPKN